jgi:hypothetical protein
VAAKVLYGLAVLAAAGFCVSLLVHLAAWAGVAPPQAAWALHFGIFVVWLPTVLVSQRLTKDFKQREFWTAALRGAPPWAATALKWLMGYAVANFLFFMFQTTQDSGARNAVIEARGFSGHWMIFYGAAAATLFSAARLRERGDQPRVCLNGHSVSLSARYCEECGSPVMTGQQ